MIPGKRRVVREPRFLELESRERERRITCSSEVKTKIFSKGMGGAEGSYGASLRLTARTKVSVKNLLYFFCLPSLILVNVKLNKLII